MLRLTAETFFVSVAVGCAVAVTAVLTQRYVAAQVDLGRQFREQQVKVQAVNAARMSQHEVRLEAIERTVYGEQRQPPPTKIIVGPEFWQRNRDRELRERITTLEKRFLRLESAFRDGGQ